MTTTTTDYYALLGVTSDATTAQIKSAYRKLAKQYHPDVNNRPDAAQKFREIRILTATPSSTRTGAAGMTGSTPPGTPPSAMSGPGTPGPATAPAPETGPPAATAPRPPAAS